MDKHRNPFFTNLRCRECGRSYPKQAIHICEFDFGPLECRLRLRGHRARADP